MISLLFAMPSQRSQLDTRAKRTLNKEFHLTNSQGRSRLFHRDGNQNIRNLPSPERDAMAEKDRRRKSIRRRGINRKIIDSKIKSMIEDAIKNNCKVRLQKLTKHDIENACDQISNVNGNNKKKRVCPFEKKVSCQIEDLY